MRTINASDVLVVSCCVRTHEHGTVRLFSAIESLCLTLIFGAAVRSRFIQVEKFADKLTKIRKNKTVTMHKIQIWTLMKWNPMANAGQ